jgi:ribosomal protein S18 acetylase RimI-like enzyme
MIAYRDAAPADGPELDAVARAIWVETFGHASSPEDSGAYLTTAYGPDGALLRHLVDPAYRFRLAVDGDRIVGYAKINAPWLPGAEPDAVQLSQLYVASDHHGAGIAQALMDWSIAAARAQNAPAMLLTVWEENHRARRFYEKLGFVHIGDYDFVVGAQIDTDLIMRLAL